MIRFDANDNGGYATVREVLRKFVQMAGTVVKDRLLSSTRASFVQADLFHSAQARLTLLRKPTEGTASLNTR